MACHRYKKAVFLEFFAAAVMILHPLLKLSPLAQEFGWFVFAGIAMALAGAVNAWNASKSGRGIHRAATAVNAGLLLFGVYSLTRYGGMKPGVVVIAVSSMLIVCGAGEKSKLKTVK